MKSLPLKKKATCQVFFICVALLFPYKCWRSTHPSQWDPTSQNCWIQSSSSKWLEPCGKVWWCTCKTVTSWWVLGFQSMWKKICQKASSDWIISPQRMKKKVWKQNLGELSSLFCCRIPLLDQRFLSLMFWRDTFFPKKTLAWTITQLFYSTVKENFFKKEKRRATTTVWSDFCLTTTFLVTIKGTS